MPGRIARINRIGRDLLRLEVKGCILEINIDSALPPIRGIRNTHSKVFHLLHHQAAVACRPQMLEMLEISPFCPAILARSLPFGL